MKKQICIRISALTETQIHELTSKLGMTQTEVVSHAVENYYQKMEDKMNKKIKTISDYFEQDPDQLWLHHGHYNYVITGRQEAQMYRENPDLSQKWGEYPTEYSPHGSQEEGWFFERGCNICHTSDPDDPEYIQLLQAECSADNGNSTCTPEELIAHHDWDVITMMMDDVVREYTHDMVGDTLPYGDNLAFLTEYLKHAPDDLVIG